MQSLQGTYKEIPNVLPNEDNNPEVKIINNNKTLVFVFEDLQNFYIRSWGVGVSNLDYGTFYTPEEILPLVKWVSE